MQLHIIIVEYSRITVYGDRMANPRIDGFSHTFRGMNRNIDFFDNEEIRMA